MTYRLVEGVPWFRYVVRFKLLSGASGAGGRWRRVVRWSPGPPWIYGEIARELDARYGVERIGRGSVSVRMAA